MRLINSTEIGKMSEKTYHEKFEAMCAVGKQLGERRDCTVKAIALAAGLEYVEALEALASAGRKSKRGASCIVIKRALDTLGIRVYEHAPRKGGGGQYTVKTIPRVLPAGKHIVIVKGHALAVVDGEVLDWSEDRKHRVHTVYTLIV
jgi:hypothetical protein